MPPDLPGGNTAANCYTAAVQHGLPDPGRLLDLHDREAQLAAFDELCDLVGMARPPRQHAPPPDPSGLLDPKQLITIARDIGLPHPDRLTGARGPEAMMAALNELLTRLGIDPPA